MTNQIHRTLDPLYTLSIQRIIKITKKQHKNFKIFKPRIFRNRRNSTTNSIKPIRRWIADLTKRSQKNCNLCAKVQPGTAAKNCENRPIYIHTPARWKRTGQRGPLSSYIFREAGALSGFSRFSPGEWWEAPSRLVSSRLELHRCNRSWWPVAHRRANGLRRNYKRQRRTRLIPYAHAQCASMTQQSALSMGKTKVFRIRMSKQMETLIELMLDSLFWYRISFLLSLLWKNTDKTTKVKMAI